MQRILQEVKKAVPSIAAFPRVFRLVWESAPGWTSLWLILITTSGVLPPITIALTKRLVDILVNASHLKDPWQNAKPIFITGLLLMAVLVFIEVLQGALTWVRTAQTELIQDHINALIHEKSSQVDLGFYESPEFYNSLYRAREDANVRVLNLLEQSGAAYQHGLTLAILVLIVGLYNKWLVLAMVLSVTPAFLIIVHHNWIAHQWRLETTVQRRWVYYYDQKLTSAASAAELRLLNLSGYFQAAYRELRKTLRISQLDLVKKQNVARLGAALGGTLVSAIAMGWMGFRTLQGQATLGDLVLFFQAFLGSQGFMRVVTMSIGQVYNSSLSLGDLFVFLDLEPEIKDPLQPRPAVSTVSRGIRFEDVTFRYPHGKRTALQKLSLFIPAGKIVAIVGPNGAGKSTLIKLLSRFYDPQDGRITVDDVDLKDLTLAGVRALFSVLFQVPVGYDASIAENIAMGDLTSKPTRRSIKEAAKYSGADHFVSQLPQGYDTLLGKSFSSATELSSGEWQRVAMARAFLSQAPVVLLDEPTSFMDSWAEVEWFDRLRAISVGRTAMVVTHRFTIAMRADLIYVVDEGRVVESGTHDELLENNGIYAQSWRDQTEARFGHRGGEKLAASNAG